MTERGTGLVASLAGLLVVLALLLSATEALVGLYAGTVVTAATHAAARQAASDVRARGGADPGGAMAEAEAELRSLLGRAGADAEVAWAIDGADLVVHTRQRRPSLLPPAWRPAWGGQWIDRTARVRLEDLR